MQTGLSYLPENRQINELIETKISFGPFIAYLEGHIKNEETFKAKFYEFVLKEFHKEPFYNSSIRNEDIHQYTNYLELIYSVLSPVISDEKDFLWALSAPLSKNAFYGTDAYIDMVNSDDSFELKPNFIFEYDDHIKQSYFTAIYNLILNRFYQITPIDAGQIIYVHFDSQIGLKKYYKLVQDTRFVDVRTSGILPVIDFETLNKDRASENLVDSLKVILPLSRFYVEGFTVNTLEDITEDYAIDMIKKALLEKSFNQSELYEQVKYALKILGGDKDAEFGLLPFLTVNNKLVFDDIECSRSILIKSARQGTESMAAIYDTAQRFAENPVVSYYKVITPDMQRDNSHLASVKSIGVNSYAIMPVYFNQHFVGVLEVYSEKERLLYEYILSRLSGAIPLVAQLLQNSIERLNQKIENIIMEKFTPLQTSVQWKFNEIALEYLRSSNFGEKKAAISTIAFENIYPLFGAVDIRNSTIERNRALNEDISSLLNLLGSGRKSICALLSKTKASLVDQQFSRWIAKADNFLRLSDSLTLNAFLVGELVPFLDNLSAKNPEVKLPVSLLKKILAEDGGEISGNRTALEAYINIINSALNKFFEGEREKLQAIYPCYFETFRTDGVEYDLYTGQSIKPGIEFTRPHLEAFRLWQLRSMCKIVSLTKALLNSMPRVLQTTQLIYVNPHPINISFRIDERHFDVEGAYNIRYQVVKKRIDKVLIKNSSERLTQPGKIAIVYFNENDLEQYLTYIKICQDEGILQNDFELLELEELQGVSGLKAVRVNVNPSMTKN